MAFYSVEVTRFFYRRGWYIQMPDEVPVMTRRGFQLIVPLLFSALVCGIAEMGDIRALGRIGWKTLG